MCDWCDTSEYENTYYGDGDFDKEIEIANGEDNGGMVYLYMLYNTKTNKYGIYANGEGEAVTDIEFCPRCGKKL